MKLSTLQLSICATSRGRLTGGFYISAGRFFGRVTIAAVDRPFLSRFKGNFAFTAAPGTGRLEHLPGPARPACLLPVYPAIRAALGLVLQSFGFVELLLSNGEDEGFTALGTG